MSFFSDPNKLSQQFSPIIDKYDGNFQVSLRKNPNNTNANAFQFKIKKGGNIIGPQYGINNFNEFKVNTQPLTDDWYDFTFNNEKDMYLYLTVDFSFKEEENLYYIQYKILRAQFTLRDELDDLNSFKADIIDQTYKYDYRKNLRYYATLSSSKLIAFLPFLGRSNVIQIHKNNDIYFGDPTGNVLQPLDAETRYFSISFLHLY